MPEPTLHDRLMKGITKWMTDLENYPGWREWNREKIGKTILFGEPEFGSPTAELGDFIFSNEVEGQHAVAYGYLSLTATVNTLKNLEFYFRRYPFSDLPVSKE
ncbi:hypothetical protein [Methylocapsa sp. S129]|uniref:hypothetical protein n=1 Tax=Methylocapsa sp. S129 TaxID=1641869 RepID=UPI00131D21CD|nr:hypothetical protein [Methylocapsa sp. S129]